MADTTIETPGQWWEKIQQVEFELLYTGLHEIVEISELQKKLIITRETQIPLLKSLNFYADNSTCQIWNKANSPKGGENKITKIFPELKIKNWECGRVWAFIYPTDYKWTNIININKCFSNNNYYCFYGNWYYFVVKKSDFDKDWYMAESLRLMSEPQKFWQWVTDMSDNDWTVKYYLNWNLEWTLKWSCFTYVSKSTNEDVAYVWHGSCIYKSNFKIKIDSQTGNNMICHDDGNEIDLELWEIKKLALDPKQNLLFVVSEDKEWNTNLHILEHKKIFNDWEPVKHEIKTIEWVSDIMIMSDWDIFLTKSNWTIDIFNTNLNLLDNNAEWSFEMKWRVVTKATDTTKKDVLESLWWLNISIDSNDVSNESSEEDMQIIEWIRWANVELDWVSKTLKEWFDEAKTEQDIEKVQQVFFKIIKTNRKLNTVHDLLKQVERKINSKKNEIILESIYSELWDIGAELSWGMGTDTDIITLFTIKDKLKSIQKKRSKIQLWVVEKDKELKQLLEIVDQKIVEYQESHKDEIEQEIEDNLAQIEEILSTIDNPIDISSVLESSIYKMTKSMIQKLDANLQTRYNKRLSDLRWNRLKQIKDLSRQEKEKEHQIIENKKREIETNMEQIKAILEELDDVSTVEQYEQNDVMVNEVRNQLEEIPSADAQKLSLKLQNIFKDRIFALRLGEEETKWVVQNLDSYGIDTALYYIEDGSEQIDWEIDWKEMKNGKIRLSLKVMNWETHEYDKSLSYQWKYAGIKYKWKRINDMSEDEFDEYQTLLYEWKKENKRQEYYELLKKLRWLPLTWKWEPDGEKKKLLEKINKMREIYWDVIYTEHLIARIIKHQKLDPRWKVPPFDPDYIVLDEEKEILRELSARLVDQKQNSWIEILEWGPGLWKTVMCEFLAHVTNREIIRVQCSKMDPSDMFFAPSLKKWDLDYEPADWVKLMQKPWTIILFDEIDKLNDQCFERLHSLFDRSKSIYHPQLWKIKANSDCLFLWTRNSYDRMPNPITSRWRILQIDYPWELNESYKISKYADSSILKKLSYEEFMWLYDKYITRREAAPRGVQEKKIYDSIINIKHLLNVFTELRRQYDSDEPFAYELSYRDARHIFVDYNWWLEFKEALEKILVPKARAAVVDKEEKDEQEQIVRRAIESEIG